VGGLFPPVPRGAAPGGGRKNIFCLRAQDTLAYAAFILNGFDDQERNLMFVKTDFQVLNLNFMPAILSRLSISSS